MQHQKIAALAAVSLAVFVSAPASAATIDFEELTFGPQTPGALTYPEASFTSSSGQFFVGGAGIGKDLCAFDGTTCTASLTVTFSAPVTNLSFMAYGDDAPSSIFYTLFLQGGGSSSGAFALDGTFFTPKPYSFGSVSDIVGIVFSDNDLGGLLYDDFKFDVEADAVPEPATWAMMIGGFAIVGASLRRRAKAATISA